VNALRDDVEVTHQLSEPFFRHANYLWIWSIGPRAGRIMQRNPCNRNAPAIRFRENSVPRLEATELPL
jgi:hypothetical protein